MVRLKPIAEQVVVIFGATSGIGRAAALKFAARGARLVVVSRSERETKALAREIGLSGGQALPIAADTASFEQVQMVADAALARYGQVDTWVHTAAVSIFSPFLELKPAEWRQVIDVNLNGQAYGAMAALPVLRQGGALILVSSVEALVALPYQSAYAASKSGMRAMIDVLTLELRHARLPISVTEIMPATINTPFYNKARTRIGTKPVGVPPVYQPEAVADAILYAAEHPVRQLVVGGAGKLLILGKRFTPGLVNAFLQAVAFRFQKTPELKAEDAPTNLFAHLPGQNRVHGDFDAIALRSSAYTRLQTRPRLRLAGLGAALGLGALLLRRNVQRHERPELKVSR